MSHAWSLAVEEQFYLLWPIVFVLARRWRAQVCVVGILACWVLQQTVGWSYHAVYVGLRWDALLAGCLLAVVGRRLPWWCFTAGACVAAVMLVGFDPGAWVYTMATLASVGLVAGVPRSLGWPWLVHVGRISYALYLWHLVAMRLDLPMVVALPLGWGLAEVTYWLLDRRVQLGERRRSVPELSPAAGG